MSAHDSAASGAAAKDSRPDQAGGLYALDVSAVSSRHVPSWLAAALFTLVLLGSLAAAYAAWRNERVQRERAVLAAAEGAATALTDRLEVRVRALQRMAERLVRADAGLGASDAWRADASQYIRDGVANMRIELVRPSGVVEAQVPQEADAVVGTDLHQDPNRRRALETARESGSPVATARGALAEGAGGIALYVPVRDDDGAFLGWIGAESDAQRLVEDMLEGVESLFGIEVALAGVPVFQRSAAGGAEEAGLRGEVRRELYGASWTLAVWPGAEFQEATRSPLPWVILAVGTILAFVMFFVARLARRSAHAAEVARASEREATKYGRELKRSNEELDRFAYVASHDLKAPLRDVDNLSLWIQEDVADDLPERSKRHFELLRGRVERMEGLLDGLLAYSRAGRLYPDPESFTVQEALEDVRRLALPDDDGSSSFTFSFPEEPEVTLHTPREPFATVLRNLVSNARKHHDRDDGRIEIDVEDRGEFVAIAVRDDGPGISPEFHERVFEMFQTLKPRDELEGTGLGLALVKKIVVSFGGDISLTSAPGEGTEFRFTWPKEWHDDGQEDVSYSGDVQGVSVHEPSPRS